MSLLVDWQILKAMKDGAIVIDPFCRDQLSDNAYDLTVSQHFWRYPKVANGSYSYVDAGMGGSVLVESGERILGASREVAGGCVADVPLEVVTHSSVDLVGASMLQPTMTKRIAVNTHLQATSTAGRRGWAACDCAGWGNVGYVNRWTFEITNRAPFAQKLPVGAILAQIAFTRVAVPEKIYGVDHGQYQKQEKWDPVHMLPGPLKVKK